jgi:hypothetical protein
MSGWTDYKITVKAESGGTVTLAGPFEEDGGVFILTVHKLDPGTESEWVAMTRDELAELAGKLMADFAPEQG